MSSVGCCACMTTRKMNLIEEERKISRANGRMEMLQKLIGVYDSDETIGGENADLIKETVEEVEQQMSGMLDALDAEEKRFAWCTVCGQRVVTGMSVKVCSTSSKIALSVIGVVGSVITLVSPAAGLAVTAISGGANIAGDLGMRAVHEVELSRQTHLLAIQYLRFAAQLQLSATRAVLESVEGGPVTSGQLLKRVDDVIAQSKSEEKRRSMSMRRYAHIVRDEEGAEPGRVPRTDAWPAVGIRRAPLTSVSSDDSRASEWSLGSVVRYVRGKFAYSGRPTSDPLGDILEEESVTDVPVSTDP
ncbi:MAG: hypothetical protein OXF02_04320 [Simkaniaceae bacterium]|nr:hypothetical protein [Simkaniaceae bacterium]